MAEKGTKKRGWLKAFGGLSVLIILNLALYSWFSLSMSNISGSHIYAGIIAIAITIFLVVPVFSLIAALLFSLIPYNDMSYGEKLPSVFVYALIAANIYLLFNIIITNVF